VVSNLTVVWRGIGQDLAFTLEETSGLATSEWHAVAPTNQWPKKAVFWSEPTTSNQNTRFFRVNATSVPSP
jgi:hypothetical protein